MKIKKLKFRNCEFTDVWASFEISTAGRPVVDEMEYKNDDQDTDETKECVREHINQFAYELFFSQHKYFKDSQNVTNPYGLALAVVQKIELEEINRYFEL